MLGVKSNGVRETSVPEVVETTWSLQCAPWLGMSIPAPSFSFLWLPPILKCTPHPHSLVTDGGGSESLLGGSGESLVQFQPCHCVTSVCC